jgi:hypothetical protein
MPTSLPAITNPEDLGPSVARRLGRCIARCGSGYVRLSVASSKYIVFELRCTINATLCAGIAFHAFADHPHPRGLVKRRGRGYLSLVYDPKRFVVGFYGLLQAALPHQQFAQSVVRVRRPRSDPERFAAGCYGTYRRFCNRDLTMPEGERSPKGIELQSSLGDHSQAYAVRPADELAEGFKESCRNLRA